MVVPIYFKSFILPLTMSLLLAVFLFISHRTNGQLMYWFQTEDNMYEVSFCIMWGLIITLGWVLSDGDLRVGVLPILFMSIGDAVTGIERNTLYKKRTKSWWGNLAMAIVSVIIGAAMGLAGILAGVTASLIEHFEFRPIDDNVLISFTSLSILLMANFCTLVISNIICSSHSII